jgi:transposase
VSFSCPGTCHTASTRANLTTPLAAHSTLLLIWLERGFAGDDPRAFLNGYGVTVEIVGTKHRKGVQLERRRWKVEQTFGCLQRYRRLRVDDEMSRESSRGMALPAALFMTGVRLERLIGS